jgi:hypothetical protein
MTVTNLNFLCNSLNILADTINKHFAPDSYISIDSVTDETDPRLPDFAEYYIAKISFPNMPLLPIEYSFAVAHDSTCQIYDNDNETTTDYISFQSAVVSFVTDFAFNTPHD